MKRLYISGPMTGIPEYNYPAFMKAAMWLREKGFEVVNPAELSTPSDDKQWVDYMREDIKHLVDCTAIYMLKGWEASKGAKLELLIAEGLGMRVLHEGALVICARDGHDA